jgi:uncharacterized protein YqgC (DUF456 family)
MSTTVLWSLAVVLMVIGAAGIVLPALPGVPLILAGMVLAASIDDFQRIGWLTIAILGVLTIIAVVVDFAASVLGAKRVGASKRALWGAFLGTIVGLFFGPFGLLLGPFIGAVVGELTVHGQAWRAGRVGIATWIGLLFGTLFKIAVACSMLGIFAFAYFVD